MFVLKVLLTLILGLVSLTLTTYFSSDEEKEKVSQPLKIEMTSEQEEIVQKAKDVIKKRTRVKKEKTLAFDLGQKMENKARLIEQPTSQTFSIKEKKSLLEKSSYEIDGYLTSKSSSHLPQGLKKQAKLLSQTIRKNIKKEGFKSSDFSKVFKKGNGRLKA